MTRIIWRTALGLLLLATAALAALMGVGGRSFGALLIAWVSVPAPAVYFLLLLRPIKRPGIRRGARSYLAVSVLLTAALLFAVAWIGSERALHPSTCEGMTELSEHPALETTVEKIEFASLDGTRLAGWLATGSRNEAVILLHGYRCDKREMLPHAEILYEAGFTVMLFDFRNRGESGGEFVSLGYFEQQDVLAAISYLNSQPDVNLDGVGVLGISSGGATAIMAATMTREIRAVAVEATFRSLDSAIAQSFTHFIGLPAFPFAPITVWLAESKAGIKSEDVAPQLIAFKVSPTPLLVMHGMADETISPADSEAIFKAALQPKWLWLIPGAGHGEGIKASPEAYADRIVAFFDEHL